MLVGKFVDFDKKSKLNVGDLVKCSPYLVKEKMSAVIIKVCSNGEYLAHEYKYGIDVRLDDTRIEKKYVISEKRR